MKADTQRIMRYTVTMLCLIAAAVAFYLLKDHREHFLGWLPYLLLLACPLMHVFMGEDASHRLRLVSGL